MVDHFNGLTPAEDERLAMLIEECSEVIKAATKIQRHGYESYNPDAPNDGTNRAALQKELIDVSAIYVAMHKAGDLSGHLNHEVDEAWARKLRYAHHQ